MIRFRCACGRRVQARMEHAGRQARCPLCRSVLTIPGRPNLFDDEDEDVGSRVPDPEVRPEPSP